VYEYACPYGAPQYNASKGHTTKCDGCYERVAVGLQPICVTSCPLRCRHLRGAGHQPTMLAVSTVVLVSAELIGRLLFHNLHMTVGLLLLVLS